MIAIRSAVLFAAAFILFASPAVAASDSFEDALKSSSALYEQGRFQEAIPYAEKALAIAERELGTDDVAYAALLDNLAALYEAEMLYAKALKALAPACCTCRPIRPTSTRSRWLSPSSRPPCERPPRAP